MNKDKIKEAIRQVIEQDDSLKYALATNLAKYGRPQSKKSDKPSKLTKGLEKKREKHVKDLKKSMDEQGSPFPGEAPSKGYTVAREIIAMLREKVYPKFNDDELEEFRNEMKDHLGLYLKEDKTTFSPDDISPEDKKKIKSFLDKIEPKDKPYYGSIKDPQKEEKKPDRCLRIARRKIPQSSVYRSGLIVKCRKGMIWKKEK